MVTYSNSEGKDILECRDGQYTKSFNSNVKIFIALTQLLL